MLGYTLIDRVTGFQGVCMGHVTYISGCNQVLVQPRMDAKGEVPESKWIDEQRMEVRGDAPRIILDNNATPGFDRSPPRP